ncbi:MAG: Rpn family recombination-promoting nuclease/putative transposase [Myxococcota bacterium]
MPGSSSRPKAHDALVRYVFSRPEAMAIELRHVLDPAIHRIIDFDSLTPLPTADVNERLGPRFADLRFSVDLVDSDVRVCLYLAFEHQSTPELLLVCRVLEYMSNMWSQLLATRPKRSTVPAILPIVLLQHPARNTPRRLTELFALTPTLRQRLGLNVELELLVDDLSGSVLNDTLAHSGPLALVEITRALLYAYENPSSLTPSRLKTLAPLFDQVMDQDSPLGMKDIRALWTYTTQVFQPDSPLRDLIAESVSRESREMYRTIADELRDEALSEGLELGRTEGLNEGIELGRTEGLNEGIELGRTEGIELGRTEGLAEGIELGHTEGLTEGIELGRTKGMLEGIELGHTRGLTEGAVRGRAESLLDVLRYRAVPIAKDQRERVLATRDERVLHGWFARAFTIGSADELFDTNH